MHDARTTFYIPANKLNASKDNDSIDLRRMPRKVNTARITNQLFTDNFRFYKNRYGCIQAYVNSKHVHKCAVG